MAFLCIWLLSFICFEKDSFCCIKQGTGKKSYNLPFNKIPITLFINCLDITVIISILLKNGTRHNIMPIAKIDNFYGGQKPRNLSYLIGALQASLVYSSKTSFSYKTIWPKISSCGCQLTECKCVRCNMSRASLLWSFLLAV